MYSLLKDIIRFFQDSGTLILDNIWVFLFFALIVVFVTITIYRAISMKKIRNIENKYKQTCEENTNLKAQVAILSEQISTLNEQLEQYYIYSFNDRAKSHTNKEFIEQLNKDFSAEE